MKKVLVCDDHTLIAEGISVLLDRDERFSLVGHVTMAKHALEALSQQPIDVLLLDLNLKDSDGFEVLHGARKKYPLLLIIILTMYREESLIQKAMKAGANAFLEKSVSNNELLEAMNRSVNDAFFLSKVLQQEQKQLLQFRDHFAGKMKLTKREIELICVLAKGKTTHEAAELLFLSPLTVETHRKNIFKKLNITNVIELVNFAHENNLC